MFGVLQPLPHLPRGEYGDIRHLTRNLALGVDVDGLALVGVIGDQALDSGIGAEVRNALWRPPHIAGDFGVRIAICHKKRDTLVHRTHRLNPGRRLKRPRCARRLNEVEGRKLRLDLEHQRCPGPPARG